MGKPKKRTTSRRTGNRRSHLVLRLARRVNSTSPVKVYTTRRRSTQSLQPKGESGQAAGRQGKKTAAK